MFLKSGQFGYLVVAFCDRPLCGVGQCAPWLPGTSRPALSDGSWVRTVAKTLVVQMESMETTPDRQVKPQKLAGRRQTLP